MSQDGSDLWNVSNLPSTEAAAAGFVPGSTFGPFTIIGLIGKGGMGQVLRARDPSTGRDLALKLTLQRGAENQDARFEREGQLTAALHHPNIVGIHSGGEIDGVPYLAYELVTGAQELDDAWGPLGLRERVLLLRDAARAVGHAHAQGITHRDLKPGNVLVDGQGRVRVADFGLAGMVGMERLTLSGQILGTPAYMAPEQVMSLPAQPVMDVWALGVMLYEAMTGQMPIVADSMQLLLAKLVAADVQDPRAHVPDLPADLAAVCMLALERDLAYRYPDAGALADDLDAWLAGETPHASGISAGVLLRRWRRPLALGGALCLVAGVVLGAGIVAVRTRPKPQPQVIGRVPPPAPVATVAQVEPVAPAEELPPWEPGHVPLLELLGSPHPGAPMFVREQYQDALAGKVDASFEMAERYAKGRHVPKDLRAAVALLRRASPDDPTAPSKMALLLLDGHSDDVRAQRQAQALLEESGERGNADAWVSLGRLHMRRTIAGADPAQGRECFQRAAALGHPGGMAELGNALLLGLGGPPDLATGLEHLRTAERMNDKRALWFLAQVYLHGLGGVPADAERGHEYVERAAALGQADAKQFLAAERGADR